MKSRFGVLLAWLFVGALVFFAAGCSSPDPAENSVPKAWVDPDGNNLDPWSNTRNDGRTPTDWRQPGEFDNPREDWVFIPDEIGLPKIYYAYDSDALVGQERAKLDAVADYMLANPELLLSIEGNCDERGTEEYNRALGERRALAVQKYLADKGVSNDRMRTLSYGKDKPAVQGSGEAVWAQNRRAEFRPAVHRQN